MGADRIPGSFCRDKGRTGKFGEGWAGHATHKRFSSPRPRKAPGCTVLMTLFLRSLWDARGGPHTSPALGATWLPWGWVASWEQKYWGSISFKSQFFLALARRLDGGPSGSPWYEGYRSEGSQGGCRCLLEGPWMRTRDMGKRGVE